jgi:hypothetical protein
VYYRVRARHGLAAHTTQPTCSIDGYRITNGAIAALVSGFGMLCGMVSGRAILYIVVMSTLVGAVISLLASSETTRQKKRDELLKKVTIRVGECR